mmetsp:Transcript_18004/g.15720  ORF Transcript_18004/g.15720 Transcript_18004/m.15720 type:complete len:113 (-) Transcript_18004:1058-1396(-)
MVPLDISNSRGLGGGIDMYFWWQIIVIIDFAFITLLIPFGIIFYRTDENKSMRQRASSAGIGTLVSFAVFCIFFFTSYVFWKEIGLPLELKALTSSQLQSGGATMSLTDIKA